MESLTKNRQNEHTIAGMVRKYFTLCTIDRYEELTEGYFNAAYEIFLSNGKSVILKIAPSKETRIMTYEKNMMVSEVETMKMVQQTGEIPLPKVIGFDDSCEICKAPYFFMEKVEGKSLQSVKDNLPPEQLTAIEIEIGRINRRINEISCPRFGYPGQPAFQGHEWYPVFQKMLKAGIDDAQRGSVDLKIPISGLLSCLEKDKAVFDEVKEPKLVHWDCWEGNVFVHNGGVSGIIDWERSLWGDPLMEVGFRTYFDHALFLKGYRMGALSEHQKRRAVWYDVYLLLLMSLECEYRKYETMDMYYWTTALLERQFRKLQGE